MANPIRESLEWFDEKVKAADRWKQQQDAMAQELPGAQGRGMPRRGMEPTPPPPGPPDPRGMIGLFGEHDLPTSRRGVEPASVTPGASPYPPGSRYSRRGQSGLRLPDAGSPMWKQAGIRMEDMHPAEKAEFLEWYQKDPMSPASKSWMEPQERLRVGLEMFLAKGRERYPFIEKPPAGALQRSPMREGESHGYAPRNDEGDRARRAAETLMRER